MRIKTWLSSKGLSQSEVAKKAGVNLSDFNQFLNKRKTLNEKHLAKIAKVLNAKLENVKRDNINP